MFNNLFGGEGPGMGEIMKMLGPLLMPGGDKREKIVGLVKQFATDDVIADYAGKTIGSVAAMQAANNQKYVLYVESTSDNSDILIRVLNRKSDDSLDVIRDLYLSQISQADIISLLNLIIPDGPAKTTALPEPKRIA